MLTGQNGILKRATEAKEKTEEAQEKECLELAVTSSKLRDMDTIEITKINLEDEIKNQFGDNKDFTVVDNEDGSFLVNMNGTKRVYYINKTGEVIDEILKISTVDELKAFRDDVNSGNTYEGEYVYLANDIVLDINEEWIPIGNRETPFKGTFSGGANEINGIYINSTEIDQALFGYTNNASIMSLGIGENCDITGGRFTAAIVGSAQNNTYIINCYNKSNIKGNFCTAGIVGQLTINGLISKCYNTGTIIVNGDLAGGICGNADNNSIIQECYNANTITGSNYIGGVIGRILTGAKVQNCYNISNVTGNTRVGGICGEARGSNKTIIQNVYNCGNITAVSIFSGIVHCLENAIVIKGIYLENSINNSNDTIYNEGISAMSSENLKKSFNFLGGAFKEDINNINSGYPILQWQ